MCGHNNRSERSAQSCCEKKSNLHKHICCQDFALRGTQSIVAVRADDLMTAAHLIHRNIVLQPKKEGIRMISESDERMRKIAQKRINNKQSTLMSGSLLLYWIRTRKQMGHSKPSSSSVAELFSPWRGLVIMSPHSPKRSSTAKERRHTVR